MRKGSALAVVVFGSSLLACVAAAPDDVNKGEQEFSTTPSEPNHEAITADGLSFLRPEVILALQAANVSTDVQFVLNSATHFDDCNFTGGSQWVREHEAAAVTAIGAGDDATAMIELARTLHTLQDFYAHSNWVETGFTSLVDTSTTAFPQMTGYATLTPQGIIVVDGTPPDDWALSRRRGAKYPANAIVYVNVDGQKSYGLISGTVDYEPGNHCPAQVAMTHDELNKDKSTLAVRLAQYETAKSLATQQTRHEWCRLLTMTRAAHGEPGDARMFSWVSDVAAAASCGSGTDVSVTTTAPASVTLGTTATVTMQVTNAGTVGAYGTTVRLELSTGLVPTSLPSNCSIPITSEASVDCYVGLLGAGASQIWPGRRPRRRPPRATCRRRTRRTTPPRRRSRSICRSEHSLHWSSDRSRLAPR